MDANTGQSDGQSWPIEMENVQIHYTDGFQLPTASTLTDAQLQQLTQAGYSFAVYNDTSGQVLQQSVAQPQAEINATETSDYESAAVHSIQDSLDHLQALQSKQIAWPPKDQKEDMNIELKQEVSGSSVLASFSEAQAQTSMSGVVVNMDGFNKDCPITFSIDGKPYDFGDLRMLKPLASETNKEISDITSLQQQTANLQHQVPSLQQNNISLQQHLQQFSQQGMPSVESPDFTSFSPRYAALNVPVITANFRENIDENTDEIAALPQSQDLLETTVQEVTHCHVRFSERSRDRTDELNSDNENVVIEHVLPSRKSKRLARMEQQLMAEPAQYSPNNQAYDVNALWCEECKRSYSGGCSLHKLQNLSDKVVLSRAWASLPAHLAIFKLSDQPDPDLGVFAKKALMKNVKFGPFVAETVTDRSELSNDSFVLKIEMNETEKYIKATNEERCNWMMFVRPAENYQQQNLIVHQYGEDLFFITMKDIQPRDELRVWYADHYAHRMNVTTHPIPDTHEWGRKEKYECYECDRTFKTAALLQKHLNEHEGEENANRSSTITQDGGESNFNANQEGTQKQEDGTFQSWKKKKRNMYFNKIRKYKEISKRAEQKREQRDKTTCDGTTNENEAFSCKQCYSTFNNANLLNMHNLTHADIDDSNIDASSYDDVISRDHLKQEMDALTSQQTNSDAQEETADRDALSVKCPCCVRTCCSSEELVEHMQVHSRPPRKKRRVVLKRQIDPLRPHPCKLCSRSFTTEERLIRHQLTHTQTDKHKPLTCEICLKKFMNNSAMACHMKTHSEEKYYSCPMCRLGFDQMVELKKHAQQHTVNGLFPCPDCHKSFPNMATIKKHVRISHPYQQLPCPVCHKIFPRADKLRLHMLSHSDHKAFMCEECGRQFKRKDKMKEHAKRMHDPANPNPRTWNMRGSVVSLNEGGNKLKFVPRVAPTEFHRFIYKCHQCLLGFKRRGMLVNHLAKRHPTVKPESVPELNLPILRAQRDFFCQYCNKVYKSSSKRKQHILKLHPGAALPPSQRSGGRHVNSGEWFSQCVGSVTTNPIHCEFCHKQYASRAKMMQHQRKDHPELVPQKRSRFGQRGRVFVGADGIAQFNVNDRTLQLPDGSVVTVQGSQETQGVQHADILTQAMSELTQNLNYRPQQTEFQITLPAINALQSNSAQPGGQDQPETSSILMTPGDGQATLDLSMLGQALMQGHLGGFTATLVTDHSDAQSINDQSIVLADHRMLNGHTVVHADGQVLNDHSVVHANLHDINEEVVTDSDNVVLHNRTQTITVPLSLASQIIKNMEPR